MSGVAAQAVVGPVPPATPGKTQSVDRAVTILLTLASMRQEVSTLEIASQTGLDRATVHRMLRTLASSGLVQMRGSRYSIGPAGLRLGAARLSTLRLRELAMPYAVEIQRTLLRGLPMIVSVSAWAGEEVVIVDRVWTPEVPLDIITGIGWRFRVDEITSGRSMLSTWSDEDLLAFLGEQRMERLRDTLARIRERKGLEWGVSEYHADICSMASPLVGNDGRAIGALVISGLDLEPQLNATSTFAQSLTRYAQTISNLIRAQP